jgi:rSAM/selenodomain-associated transferase 1
VWIILLKTSYCVDKASFPVKKALLVFAKQPVAGRVKTRLSPPLSARAAAELYRCMLADTLQRITSLCQVQVILFFDPADGAEVFFRETWPDLPSFPQEGDGLGERLENAFARVFSSGFTVVAAMGTDSPDLPLRYVEDAFRTLEEGAADVVFGPTTDGGYYLVAMGRLYPELFRAIPWSSGQVLAESLVRADADSLVVALLPEWEDMDTIAELRRFILRETGGDAPLTRKHTKALMSRYL